MLKRIIKGHISRFRLRKQLMRYLAIVKPFLKIMIPKWNEKVWLEDLPIKIRRQKVLNMNFKDFKGLPEKINEREKIKDENYSFKLPIPRPINSSRDRHPLALKFRDKIK